MRDLGILIRRLIIAMLVVGLTSFFTPGMKMSGGIISTSFFAAIAIALIQYVFINILGVGGKTADGSIGFFLTAIILYLTGKFVSSFNVNMIGALIGAVFYGFISGLLGHD